MKLPRYTFLTGPKLACQILGADLSQTDAELMQVSVQTPVEAALCATFFENDPSLYIHDKLELPLSWGPASTFTNEYTTFLRSNYGEDILAQLAIHAMEENGDYFERFAILDAAPIEILTMCEHFGRNRCLVLHLNSPRPAISAGIYSLGFDASDENLSTADRIRQLTVLLEQRK